MNRTYLLEFLFCVIIIHLSRGQDFCTPFPALENGEVSQPSPIERFSLATFSCNEGYKLQGSDTRACLNNGLWTGADSSCTLVDCLPLPLLTNGDISVNTTTFMSTASYSCDLGYQLDGDVIRTCQLNGSWSGIEPVCNSIDCGPLTDPGNGLVMVSTTIFMSIAAYSCNSGYTLEGDITRTCQFNGSWSGAEPACNLVDCLPLPLLTNGDISVNTTTFMSTASYSCDLGYQLDGDVIRTCQLNGSWSGIEPVCNSIDCGPLTDPGNGLVMVSTTIFMSTAAYSCNSGYTLEGDITRTCQFNGAWSGAEPACNFVDCGPPPTLENGGPSSVTTTTTVNSFVMYECNEGYLAQDAVNTISFCQADGQWSNISVTCQIVTCNRLFPPFQATISFTSMFNFGSEAIYSCITGFEIVQGSAFRICQASGSWNGTQPSCERVNCGSPSSLSNGSVTVGLTTFNSLAGYGCDDGFLLDPPSQEIRSCTANRVWSGPDPTCNSVDCGFLAPPLFGSVELKQVNQTSLGAVANYACLRGYQLLGNSSRTCLANGEWSSMEPLCEELIQCPELTSPPNGLVNITSVNEQLSHTTGSIADYQCGAGYEVLGNQTRVCLRSGNWSDMAPTCEDVNECMVEGGDCSQDCVNTVGSFECVCSQGYSPSGDGVSCEDIDECFLSEDDCHSNASCTNTLGGFSCSCQQGFQGDGRTCILDCGLLLPLANGTITYTPGTLVGGVAIHKCDEGFIVQGGEERVCLEGGEWESAIIFCLKVVHVEFEPKVYRVLETVGAALLRVIKRNSTDREVNVFFNTRAGTAVAPRDYLERQNLKLTLAPGQMEEFVTISIVDGAGFRDNVTVFGVLSTTDVGVTVGPEAMITIIEDEPPNEECVSLESPTNGQIFLNGTQIGDTVSYQCDTGFNLVGEVNRTCNSVGLWTSSQPTCQIADCGPLSNPPNGTVTLTLTTYLSVANYSCDPESFRLEGAESRVCTEEGVWSSEEPICEDVFAVCDECHPRASCVRVGELQYGCECLRGFQGDGLTCVDVDECARGSGNCDENANCINTEGGHSCVCRPGYRGGGLDCQNIDECSEASHSCHQRAICTDTEGSFTCVCRPGFEGDGFSCEAPPCSSDFQLVLESIVTCSQWFTVEPQAKISDLTAGVLTTVNNECGDDCMLLSSQITNAQLDCTTSNVAVYRATLDVTNGENCTQLIAILQDWISTSPSLVVQSVRIRIASYCEVEFESVDIQSDCMNPSDNGTRPTTGTQATEQTPSGESEGVQLSMIEIIAVSAVGGGVALLLILTLLIICCVFIVRISRISKTRPPGFVEGGASASNDALSFQETSAQRQKRIKPTYVPDLAQGSEFSTFTSSNDFTTPALRSSYSQMTTPLQGGDTIMHNQGVADIEFNY